MTLIDVRQDAGYYTIKISNLDISSGVYYYTLTANSPREAGNFIETKKMLLIK